MKLLKRLEHYLAAIFTLGRVRTTAKEAQRFAKDSLPRLQALEAQAARVAERSEHAHERGDVVDRDLAAMQASLDARNAHMADIDGRYVQVQARLDRQEALADELIADYRREAAVLKRTGQSDTALLARMFSDISRRMDGGAGVPPVAAATTELPHREGFDLFKDSFYHRLENQWRGAPEEIARRLKVYLPDIEAAWARTGEKPVMDLGCGRGEWLGLLRDHGIAGFGVDTNAVQTEEGRVAGLDLRTGDGLAALADQPDASLSALTAHHLIEHLPFDAVAWITREACRVLAPGGVLLFETPNTRNVLVGATTFHTDPTHLKPMPEQVMGVLLETAGFDPIELRGINPHERLGEFLDRPGFDDELAMLMFGPQDLAILGRRPQDT